MRRFLAVLLLAALVTAGCSKRSAPPPAAPASDETSTESSSSSASRPSAASDECTPEVLAGQIKPTDYYRIMMKAAEARIDNLNEKLRLIRKFDGYSSELDPLFLTLDQARDARITAAMEGTGLSSLSDLEPSESCAEAVREAREKYLGDNSDLKGEYEMTLARAKQLEDELAGLSGAAGATAPAGASSGNGEEESENGEAAANQRQAMVEAKEYWDHQIMLARSMREYLERVRDIVRDKEGDDARAAMQALGSEFEADIRNQAMAPAMSGENDAPGSAEARDQYLSENPGIRQEFNEINSDLRDLRVEIMRLEREAEQRHRSQPMPPY